MPDRKKVKKEKTKRSGTSRFVAVILLALSVCVVVNVAIQLNTYVLLRGQVEDLEKQIEEEILKISLDLSSYKPKEKATKLEIMQSQLEKEQIKLKRLYNLYADGNNTVLEMIKELETQIKEMKSNIATESKNAINTQKKEFVYENIKKLADIWDNIDKKQKNMILKTIIDKIIIVNGNIEIQLKNF